MGTFEHFPYTNFHDLNLDWIVQELEKLATDVRDFISINAIKYANPIQWDITSQYEKNTVVLDKDGNAYLSVQPVPAGVSLDRTEYWTNIGNFSALWESVKNAITIPDEGHETTASAPRAVNDLVWVNNKLLEITSPMIAGDTYVEGSNCRVYTMQIMLKEMLDSFKNADNKIQENSNKIQENSNKIQENSNKIRENSNKIQENSNKIREIEKTEKINNVYYLPETYGAVGDGVTDDTNAINECISAAKETGGTVLFTKKYLYKGTITTGNGLRIDSLDGAELLGGDESSRSDTCIIFAEEKRAHNLPNIQYYNTGIAIKSNVLEIHCSEIWKCGTAVKIIVENGGVLDCDVFIQFITECDIGYSITKNINDATACQGNNFYTNFILRAKTAIEYDSAAVNLTGVDANTFMIGAYDPNEITADTPFVYNKNSAAVNNTRFKCFNWIGGFANGSKAINGKFNSCIFELFKMPEYRWNYINIDGTNNVVTADIYTGLQLAAYEAATTSVGWQNWNSGQMVNKNFFDLKFTLAQDLPDGEEVKAYFYHALTDRYTNPFIIVPSNNNSTNGLQAVCFRNNSITSDHEMIVFLRNYTGKAIPSGTQITFGIKSVL